ncbi:hypothetical protein [Nannocystis bainbridge]|uniref:Uncharacterized protein n=1 Tax=Nannocystis bainbridge TaxID=2995303 RepID=A0ABT5DV45_9BACT|nr:hypothetical protein [Nannocystis bainbridge]MDC0716297.1 hypothetical protein [Nannocystis bainbridge]
MTDDRRLDPFLAAAAAEAERSATRPPPSFAAVLARAHSLAPDAVAPPAAAPTLSALPFGHVLYDMPDAPSSPATARPPGHAPSAGPDAPPARTAGPSPDPHAADLAPFLTAARGLTDADVAAQLRRPLPPLPRPRPRVPLLVWAAAAALLLLAGAGALRRLADPAHADRTAAQADDTVRGRPQQHQSEPRVPSSNVRNDMSDRTGPEGHIADHPAEHVPAPQAPAAPAQKDISPLKPAPSPVSAARKPVTDALADQLARLDDEAEALLLAGALDQADARYQQMIAIGGRRAAVEHAFADRWLLARRQGDDAGHRQLLHAYLKKFPRGRFADEASAGLCRLADADARPDCWRAYRERFPAGAYRREADEAAVP